VTSGRAGGLDLLDLVHRDTLVLGAVVANRRALRLFLDEVGDVAAVVADRRIDYG
jgi:hypothetical protein